MSTDIYKNPHIADSNCCIVRDLKKFLTEEADFVPEKSLIGLSGFDGKKHTEATKKLMSECRKGKKRGPYTLDPNKPNRKGWKNGPQTDEHKRKISESQKARLAKHND